jgi:hypothetical protein
MPNYHLSLIGAQVMPVYNGICYAKPDKVFLLHSKDTKMQAENIKSAINIECLLIPVKDAHSYSENFKKVTQLFNSNKNVKWSVNLAGGTKIMALAANEISTNIAYRFVIDQNNIVHNLNDGTLFKFDNKQEIEIYFKLINQKVIDYTKFEQIPNDFFALVDFILENFQNYSDLVKKYKQNPSTNFYQNILPHDFDYHYSIDSFNNCKWIASDNKLILKLNSVNFEIISEKAFNIFFYYAWFELEICSYLNLWDLEKQIYWSSKIPYKYSENYDKNEVDIIVNTPEKMFFIECKTNVKEIKDIDKFTNVVKNYGGLGAKAFLITRYKPKPNILERCTDNKINNFYFYENFNSRTKKSETDLLNLITEEYQKTNPI